MKGTVEDRARELRSCPFCGGEPEREKFTGDHSVSYWVACNKCGGTIDIQLTPQEADDMWNTRSSDATQESHREREAAEKDAGAKAKVDVGKYDPATPYIPPAPCRFCGSDVCMKLHEEEIRAENAA